ncbi:MAG TPA: MlaD family protein [Alphaproteobacteria bacterium]|mgnify:CR=1 FL=1|jgi:phospholipid/cholesterol/gamma-HCH transport system substrate-binding protein|nr:MlaD family protein [Alphaproteobacteria bacterium]HJM50909.1 MlaD family protein [Alphaproteobacteria bacterium]
MAGNLVETLVGAVVLAVAALFLGFAYNSTDMGAVVGQELDTKEYLAVVRLSLDPQVRLPEDSSAAVVSEGLLGGKYLSLTPGGADDMLEAGDEIQFTQPSVNLEELIGKFMFSAVEEDEDGDENEDEDGNGGTGSPADDGKNAGDKK